MSWAIIDCVRDTGPKVTRTCVFSIDQWLDWTQRHGNNTWDTVLTRIGDPEFKNLRFKSIKPFHIQECFIDHLRHPVFYRAATNRNQWDFSQKTIDFIRKELGIVL